MAQRGKRGGKQKGAGGDAMLGQRVLGRMQPLVSGWSREWLANDARSVQPRHFRLLALSPALSLPRVAQGYSADLETLLEPRDTPMALNARFAAAGLGDFDASGGAERVAPETYFAPTLEAPQPTLVDSGGWQDEPLQELVTDEATAALEIPYELLAQYQEGWDAGAPDLRDQANDQPRSDEGVTAAARRPSVQSAPPASISQQQSQQPRVRAVARTAQTAQQPIRSVPQAAIQPSSMPLAYSPSEQYSRLLAERIRRAQTPMPVQVQPQPGAPQQTVQAQSSPQTGSVNPAVGALSIPQPQSGMPATQTQATQQTPQGQPAQSQPAQVTQPARQAASRPQATQWDTQKSKASAITDRIREAALARERGAEAPVYNAAAAASTASELDQRLAQGMRKQLAEREGIDPSTLSDAPVVRKPSADEAARRAERWRAFSRVEVLSTATPAPAEEGVLPKAAPVRPEDRAAIQGVSTKPATPAEDDDDAALIELGAVEVIDDEAMESPNARQDEVAAAGEFNEDGDLIDAEYEVRGVSEYAAPTYEPVTDSEPVAQLGAPGEGEFEDFESMLAELEEGGEVTPEPAAPVADAAPVSAPATAQVETLRRPSLDAAPAESGTGSGTATGRTTGEHADAVSAADTVSPVASAQVTGAESVQPGAPAAEQPSAKPAAKGRGRGKARGTQAAAEAESAATLAGEQAAASAVPAPNASATTTQDGPNADRSGATNDQSVTAQSTIPTVAATGELPAQLAASHAGAAPVADQQAEQSPEVLATIDAQHSELNALPPRQGSQTPAPEQPVAATQESLATQPSAVTRSQVSAQSPAPTQSIAADAPSASEQATNASSAATGGMVHRSVSAGAIEEEAVSQEIGSEIAAQSVISESSSEPLALQPPVESEMPAASSVQPSTNAQVAPQLDAPESYETLSRPNIEQPGRPIRVKPVQSGAESTVQPQAWPEQNSANVLATPDAVSLTDAPALADTQTAPPPVDVAEGDALSGSANVSPAAAKGRVDAPAINGAAQNDAPTPAQRPPHAQSSLQDELPLVRPILASADNSIIGQERTADSISEPTQGGAPLDTPTMGAQPADVQSPTFDQTEPQTPLEAWVRRSLEALFAEGATVAPPTDEFGKQALAYRDSLRTESLAERALEAPPEPKQGSEPGAPPSSPGGTVESTPAGFTDLPTPEHSNTFESATQIERGSETPSADAPDAPRAVGTRSNAPSSAPVRVVPATTPRASAAAAPTVAASAPAAVIQRTPAEDAQDEWTSDQPEHFAPQVGHVESAPQANGAPYPGIGAAAESAYTKRANGNQGKNGVSQIARAPELPYVGTASPANYAGAPQSDLADELPLVQHRRNGATRSTAAHPAAPHPAAPSRPAAGTANDVGEPVWQAAPNRGAEPFTESSTERAAESPHSGGEARQPKAETTTRKVPESVVRQAYGLAPPTLSPPAISRAPSNVVQTASVEVIQRDATNDNGSQENHGPDNKAEYTVNLAEIARMVYPLLRDMLRVERDRFGR